jgi:uncharacterized glyoxalase superfamily protein PhnB
VGTPKLRRQKCQRLKEERNRRFFQDISPARVAPYHQAAGAEMVLDIRDMDYGGRGFTWRDLEGHIWSIGTYDPWDLAETE